MKRYSRYWKIFRQNYKNMQTQKGVASVILVVVIVVLVVVAGFFAYQYFAPKTQPVTFLPRYCAFPDPTS